jgi:uncharacterized protein (TIGR02646 family)
MKRVFKGTEPESLIQWMALANEHWQPTYDELRHPQKADLHQALLQEQMFCCCYCGVEIDASNSHIEHFRPQEKYEPLALDYQNLHASCLRTLQKFPVVPLHCGHNKANEFDEGEFISPLEADCEQRFRFLLTGQIQSDNSEDHHAHRMIDVLALDIAHLNNRREQALSGWFDDDFLIEASQADLQRIAQACRNEQASMSYSHVVARYAEQLLLE